MKNIYVIKHDQTGNYFSGNGECGDFLIKELEDATIMDKDSAKWTVDDMSEFFLEDEKGNTIVLTEKDTFSVVPIKMEEI